MRKILIVAAVISLFVFASVCSAQESWRAYVPKGYVGAFGGASFPMDLETENNPDVGLDTSWVLGVKVGGFFAKPLILELEYYHIGEMDLDNKRFADSVSADSLFLNVILRYPETRFHPFIGAGVGWAWSHLKNVNTGFGAISADDNNWAVQGLAGVDFDITEKIFLTAQYRYFYTEPSFITSNDSKVKSHLLTIGVNYLF
ncbi:MAG: OmpW family outer membrane protein [Syntrophaceae bacterium]